jgi:hypothetical protein
MRDLQRKELVAQGLPLDWHGELQVDLVCYSEIAGEITVPRGLLTDGASIPKLFWNLLSDTDPDILYPSYAHDYIYQLYGKMPNNVILTQKQADQIIREQMIGVGAPKWKADTVYNSLRTYWTLRGGWTTIHRPVVEARAALLATKQRLHP